MIRSIYLVLTSLVFFTSAASASTCYELSENGNAWSRTPEVICVTEGLGNNALSQITLETGLFDRQVVATFQMDLLQRARCVDCNQDVYGLANPSNSIFNNLKISFDGHGMGDNEAGSVTIGANRFFYQFFSRD